jgi:hypothetical protein
LKAWRSWLESDFQFALLTIAYVVIGAGLHSDLYAFRTILLVGSIAVYLAFMILVNDYFDMPFDEIAGKKRSIFYLPKPLLQLLLLALIFGTVATLASISNLTYTLLYVTATILTTLYSIPKPRLKEKGAVGVVADVTFEKTLPALMVGAFYGWFNFQILLIVILGSAFHLEMILHHQLEDYENDRASGVETFVSSVIGKVTATRVLDRYVRPLATLLFLVFCSLVMFLFNFTIVILLVALLVFFVLRTNSKFFRVLSRDKYRPAYFSYVVVILDNLMGPTLALYLTILDLRYLPIALISFLSQSERYLHFGGAVLEEIGR